VRNEENAELLKLAASAHHGGHEGGHGEKKEHGNKKNH
jgi:hypothetical protein